MVANNNVAEKIYFLIFVSLKCITKIGKSSLMSLLFYNFVRKERTINVEFCIVG